MDYRKDNRGARKAKQSDSLHQREEGLVILENSPPQRSRRKIKFVVVAAVVLFSFAASMVAYRSALAAEVEKRDSIKLKSFDGYIEASLNASQEDSDILSLLLGPSRVRLDIVPKGEGTPVKNIELEGVDAGQVGEVLDLGLDGSPSGDQASGQSFVRVYALDPTKLDFESGKITAVASGRSLYKCADWDFSSQSCPSGKWKKVSDIRPGDDYSFTLSAGDPGFGESNAILDVLDSGGYLVPNNQTVVENNSGVLTLGVTIMNNALDEIVLYGYDGSAAAAELRVENRTAAAFAKGYSIDPTNLSFANATARIKAAGRSVFKCADWNFTAQACPSGRWRKVGDIRPGQEYNLTLTADDPGFGESNAAIDILDKDRYLIKNNQTILANNSGILDVNVTGLNTTTVGMVVRGHNDSSTKKEAIVISGLALENETRLKEAELLEAVNLSFSNYTVVRNGTGAKAFECTLWNETTQRCDGDWKKILDKAKGLLYDFTVSEARKAIAESNYTIALLDKNLRLLSYNETILNRSGDLVDAKYELRGLKVKEIKVFRRNESSAKDEFILQQSYNFSELSGFRDFSYRLDPNLTFERAELRINATSKYLYKCLDWNVTAETCQAGWSRLKVLTPGQDYLLNLTPGDPVFLESNKTITLVNRDGSELNVSNVTIVGSTAGFTDFVLTLNNHTISSILINDYNYSSNMTTIRLDDLINHSAGANWSEIYALDPTNLSFANATVTAVAQGSALYKCTSWDFASQSCPDGNWIKLARLTPGQSYNFTINSTDPAFGEILHPDEAGKDTFIRASFPNRNYGEDTRLEIKSAGNDKRALLEVNLSHIPPEAAIASAQLVLYRESGANANPALVAVYRVNSSWLEGTGLGTVTGDGATWDSRDGSAGWGTAGGDYDPAPIDAINVSGNGFYTWNVTSLVQGWVNKTWPNYGFLLAYVNDGETRKVFSSSDSINATRRPMLTINYTIPLNFTFVSPTPLNGSTVNGSSIFVNVTLNGNATGVLIEWNGVNETMLNSSGSVWFINKTGLSSGNYTYKVYANDSQTRILHASEMRSVAVENSPPTVPVPDLLKNNTFTADNTPFFNWSASTDADNDQITYHFQIDNDTSFSSPLVDNASITATNFTPGAIADGAYYWRVRAEAPGANSSYVSGLRFTIDATAPSVTLLAPAHGAFLRGSRHDINGTASDANAGAIVTNDTRWSVNPGTYTSWAFRNTSSVSDGFQAVLITANDSAGNSASVTANFTVDNTAPATAYAAPTPAAGASLSSRTIVINVTHTEANADKIVFFIDGAASVTQAYSGSFTNRTFVLEDGNHSFGVAVNDSAGNSASLATRTITIDTIKPQIGGLGGPSGSLAFSPTATYRFNATVVDANLEDVIFEFNGVNYSYAAGQLTKSGSSYSRTLGPLAAGNYSYRWYANDSAGNLNLTAARTFTVTKAAASLTLSFSPDSTIGYNTTTTVACSANNGESVPALTRNGTSVSNPDTAVLAAGIWNYACTSAATQNYTGASASGTLTINKATPLLSISLVPGPSVTYGTTVNVSCSASTGQVTPALFRNGSATGNPSSAFLAAGSYSYTCNSTATQNYTYASSSATLTVSKAPTTVTLLLNGTALNQQVVYNTITSASASTDVLSVVLYRNATQVTNPEAGILPAGVWNYTAINPGNENYSASDSTLYLTVAKAPNPVNLTINGLSNQNVSVIYGTVTNVSGSASRGPVTLYRNGENVSNPDVSNLSTGLYEYIVNTAGDENYTSNSTSFVLIVKLNITSRRLIAPLNLSAIENITVLQNLSLEANGTGRIVWAIANISSNINFDAAVNITQNFVRVDSKSAPGLNATATITFFNVTLSNPIIQYDPEDDGTFTDCPPDICVFDSYSGGTYTFNVTRFSSYRLTEAPSVSSSGKVSSGSGGTVKLPPGWTNVKNITENKTGMAIIENRSVAGGCSEKWECSEWGECTGGLQTRACTDRNGCGTENSKPEESRSCNSAETCNDGVQNQDETGVDCGGSVCAPCTIPITGSLTSRGSRTPMELLLGYAFVAAILAGFFAFAKVCRRYFPVNWRSEKGRSRQEEIDYLSIKARARKENALARTAACIAQKARAAPGAAKRGLTGLAERIREARKAAKAAREIEVTEIRRPARARAGYAKSAGSHIAKAATKLRQAFTFAGGSLKPVAIRESDENGEKKDDTLSERLACFEMELERKAGFLYESFESLRSALKAVYKDVIKLYNENRKLMKRLARKRRGGLAGLAKLAVREHAGAIKAIRLPSWPVSGRAMRPSVPALAGKRKRPGDFEQDLKMTEKLTELMDLAERQRKQGVFKTGGSWPGPGAMDARTAKYANYLRQKYGLAPLRVKGKAGGKGKV